MKTKTTTYRLGLVFMFALIAATAAPVVADPPNYGLRAVRITSLCTAGFPVTPGLPEVPPPNTVSDPNCPSVPTLAASPSGRWSVDISWFEPTTQTFYMADRNNFSVDIINTNTDTIIGAADGFVGLQPTYTPPNPLTAGFAPVAVANNSGPNGVLTINNGGIHQLWAGDGVHCTQVLSLGPVPPAGTVVNVTCTGTSHVVIFTLGPDGLPTSSIPFKSVDTTGLRRADEMAYDPDDQVVLVANDDDLDLFVSFIRVSSIAGNVQVLGKISLPEAAGCGIEQPVYDHFLNRFLLAVPCTTTHTNGEIAVINPVTMTIEKVYGLDGTNCFPHGLTLGPRENLLLGCSGDAPKGTQMKTIIMKATTGAILQTFTQLGGSDEVWFNIGDNHYYLAMSSWTSNGLTGGPATPSLGIINAGTADTGPGAPSFVQNILTTRTSHSVAAVYAVKCDNGQGNGNGNGGDDHAKSLHANNGSNGNGNNGNHFGEDCRIARNRVYVPLTTTKSPFTATNPPEPGGFGVYGQIP